LFKDIVSIVIGVTYGTKVFRNISNIKITHKVAYQKIIRKENYLELSEEESLSNY